MKSILLALTITGALLATYSLVNLQRANANTKFLMTPEYSGEIHSAWNHWRQQFGKTYGTSSDEAFRLGNFAANYNEIQTINSNSEFTWTAGLNQFSDLTKAEFKLKYTGHKESSVKRTNQRSLKHLKASDSKDWVIDGAVTPVKDQGACGSCWAFSATGAMEGLNYLLHNKLDSYSEQFFLNCDKSYPDMGCNGGNSAIAMMRTEKTGIITEDRMPYDAAVQPDCYWSKYTSDFFNNDLIDVPKDDNEEMVAAIDRQPISIAVAAEKFMHYQSGIFNDWTCGNELDHAILAVGYGSENGKLFYKVKNSWNTTWGEAGYIRFARKTGKSVGMCGLTSAACYPTGENPKP